MTRKELIDKVLSVAEPLYGLREAEAIARLFAERRANFSAYEQTDFASDLADIAAARPVQYVLGVADFYDLELAVGEGVLIPRPETEELVRWILDDVRTGRMTGTSSPTTHRERQTRILDIGTGSGAIAISLAQNLPQALVSAIDASPKALKYAHSNSAKYADGVRLEQADILDPNLNLGQFDIIVSNPPYIPESERVDMHDNITRHEPPTALFVPDDDPLKFYRAIARFARRSLDFHASDSTKGALYLEVHENFAHETASLLNTEGFVQITVKQDINGKNRMIRATL